MSKLSSALPVGNSVYDKVYRAIEFLSTDPHHGVSAMAQTLVTYLRQKVKSKDALSRPSLSIPAPLFNESLSAASEPNSPSKHPTPPHPPPASGPTDGMASLSKHTVSTIKEEDSGSGGNAAAATHQQHLPAPPTAGNGNSSHVPRKSSRKTSSSSSTVSHRTGGRHPSGHHPGHQQQPQPQLAPVRATQSASNSLLANTSCPRPEMNTEFIPWSARYFTKQLMKHDCIECDCDHESNRHWSREWMYNRNAKIRTRADQEYSLLRHKMAKIDSSLHSNLPNTTSVIRCQPQTTAHVVFHPFDPVMIAAGNNTINVLNPQYGSVGNLNDVKLGRINISSLEMANAHDEPVLLVGYANGGVVVLRDFMEHSTLRVVAAWNGLRELELSQRRLQPLSSAAAFIASSAPAKSSWCQNRSTLAMASDCRFIRLWDAKKEIRIMDLFTEDSTGAVTSLNYAPTTSASSMADLLVAGFTGGSVKLFDAREWGRAPVLKLDELQGSPILDAKIQDCGGRSILLAGNAGGMYYSCSKLLRPRRNYFLYYTIILYSN